MRAGTRLHYGPGLLANRFGEEVVVRSDLRTLDAVCPREVAKFDLVPPAPCETPWPPR